MFDFLPDWLKLIIAGVLVTIWIRHIAADVFNERIMKVVGALQEQVDEDISELEERIKELEA